MAKKIDGIIRIDSLMESMPALNNLKQFTEGIKDDYDAVSDYCDNLEKFKGGFKDLLDIISSNPTEAAIKGIATLTVSIIRLNEEMQRQQISSHFGDIKISLEEVGRLVDPISERIDKVAGAFAENEAKLSTAVTSFTDIAEAVRETADSFKRGDIEQNVGDFVSQLDKLLDSALEVNAATFDTSPLRKAFAMDGVIDDEEQAVLDKLGEMGRSVADRIKDYGEDIHKITNAAITENRDLTEAEIKNLETLYQKLSDMSTRHEQIKTAAAWERLKDGEYSFDSYAELAEKIKATQEQAEKSREAVEISVYESAMEQVQASREVGKYSDSELEQVKQDYLEKARENIAKSRAEDKRYEREVILTWAQSAFTDMSNAYTTDPEELRKMQDIFDMMIMAPEGVDIVGSLSDAAMNSHSMRDFNRVISILDSMKNDLGLDLGAELSQLNTDIGDSAFSLDEFYDTAKRVVEDIMHIGMSGDIASALEALEDKPQEWSDMIGEWAADANNFHIKMTGEFDKEGFDKEMDAYLAQTKKELEINIKPVPADLSDSFGAVIDKLPKRQSDNVFSGLDNLTGQDIMGVYKCIAEDYEKQHYPSQSSYALPPIIMGPQTMEKTFEFPIYINGEHTETIKTNAPVALRPNWGDQIKNNGQGR